MRRFWPYGMIVLPINNEHLERGFYFEFNVKLVFADSILRDSIIINFSVDG